VLPLDYHDPQALAPLMPRLFVDAFRALPLRVAAGKLVYLGFEDRLDPVLALAVARMSGLRVESGLVAESQFGPAHERMLSAAYSRVELLEAVSEPVLVRQLTRVVERVRPVESRLVRVHDCLWLRMWSQAQSGALPEAGSVQDVIATIGGQGAVGRNSRPAPDGNFHSRPEVLKSPLPLPIRKTEGARHG
jgi:hypothetical protein